MKLGLVLMVLASGACGEHCEWSTEVDSASAANASLTITGGDPMVVFENETVSITSISGTGSFRFATADAEPGSGPEVQVWSLPRQIGVHDQEATVVLLDRTRIEVAGSVAIEEYGQATERNPDDAYTSGGSVTAVHVVGTLLLSGESDGLAAGVAIDFDIRESLERDCFDCPGIEGCNY